MKRFTLLLCLILLFAFTTVSYGLDFKGEVIYQIMIDRFYDGDTSNNNPSKAPGLYDSTMSNWKMYWGGDLKGITQKIPYLSDLGITALWITPVHDNIDVAAYYNGQANAGYHGYWARDFKKIDEHFGTWTDFDQMIQTAHNYGIKVLVDYAPNHTSPTDINDPNFAERGALYYNGVKWDDRYYDSHGYWHHDGGITNWDDRFEAQYKNLADLADLAQEHSTIDSYLKEAATDLVNHGVDGFRIDAIKHMTMGWQLSLTDHIINLKDVYMTGEWYLGGYGDALYDDNVKFANRTGIAPLDFYLNKAMRDVFAYNSSFTVLNNAIVKTGQDYKWANDLPVFLDNHDMARFLSINSDYTRLHQALAFVLTCRGIPLIYYGTEQYLHDDTSGGGDPWNRPMMNNWNQNSTAYNVIKNLSSLRQSQPAIQYGDMTQKWINDNVYIYQRKFFNDVVLVAINKNSSSTYVSGLYTDLASGTYNDYLSGLLCGTSITVNSSGAVNGFNLPGNSVSVWTYKTSSSTPLIGSVGPVLGRSGNKVTIGGDGFGTSGTVYFNNTSASVTSWSNNEIQVTVPSVSTGIASVKVVTSAGTSNTIDYEVLTGKLIPIVFTVRNAYTNLGDQIYLTGNVQELGKWSTDFEDTYGPMLCPNYPEWYIVASVPAGTTIQFKFIKVASDGTVTWEGGNNHTYTVPTSGTGNVTVDWQ
ncbi:MAG: alpha amylase C-terminal domain-containing protein [Halanaerobiales bacterium]|nr:alpha amylase C-terminal domain-containing protein [Halanaerobiales bacterium]